jgi:hypothetical protein
MAVCCARLSVAQDVPVSETATLIPPAPQEPGRLSTAMSNGFVLPEYALAINLDTDRRIVAVNQTVRWTNPGPIAANELVFHVVPNNKPDDKTLFIADRTVESLRIDPRFSIDREGRRFHLESVQSGESSLIWHFDSEHDTHLRIRLARPVAPGETAEVALKYWIEIPQLMGRLGQHKGITNLLNWYPILATYGADGWDAVPYVPWHQPWLNEAGNYSVQLQINADQEVATGGRVTGESVAEDGSRILQINGVGLRDFTIVASNRFEVYETAVNGIPVRVLSLPEHQGQARLAMQVAAESIRDYSEWFGPYAYDEFELVESYFGWNGNESSGLVMIDERILDTPRIAGRYIEHLVSHEVCHQWWFSAVGTDGYREPWVDEGLAQWFTRVRMEDNHGSNAEVLELPRGKLWGLPNINYRSLVHSGYSMYYGRGGDGSSLGSLEDMGHLHNLFFLVYDKGARVVGMIQHRLGRERFFQFAKILYTNYRFRILRAADVQRELETFTGESWQQFFDDWLRSGRTADWKVADVDVKQTEAGYQTAVHIVQKGEISEPVEISFEHGDRGLSPLERKVRFDPATLTTNEPGVAITQDGEKEWTITLDTPDEPQQVEIDPEGWVLDVNRRDNRWKREFAVRYSPLYTPLDEAALTQPWEQQSIVFGPGFDKEGRIGYFGSLVESNKYRVTPFLAYTTQPNSERLSAGIEAIFYNVPDANWQAGARFEHSLLTNGSNTPGNQARFYLRKVLAYTTSLIADDLSYFELYSRIGDNFFPDQDTSVTTDPRVQDYDNVRALGFKFHADTRIPYWDPDRGWLFDASYEHGVRAFGDGQDYDRVEGQFAGVQRLPDGLGWLSETKVAGRVAGGYGWQDNGEHFRFGGPGRFRGRHTNSTEGNAFWLTSAEWRFPLTEEMNLEVADNLAQLRSVDAAVFYDVGESYLFDKSQGGVDHAVGAGLYFDLPLLSFVERLTFRVEYGQSLVTNTGVFWFGLYRAF